MRRHADSLYYGTSCNVAFDITESQFKYRLLAAGSAHTWCCCFVAHAISEMTFGPQRYVSGVLLALRLHAPLVPELKSFLNPKSRSLEGAFVERRAKHPDEEPLGSRGLVTVPV